MERTFAIIKPDAVRAKHAGQILARIEKAGFLVRGMRLAGRFSEETHHIRGTLAFTSLDYVATLWTRRKFEPNREHALEILADNWYHLLCDEG